MGWRHITRPLSSLVLFVGMCSNILIPTNYPRRTALNGPAVSNYTMTSGQCLLGPASLAFKTNTLLGSGANVACFPVCIMFGLLYGLQLGDVQWGLVSHQHPSLSGSINEVYHSELDACFSESLTALGLFHLCQIWLHPLVDSAVILRGDGTRRLRPSPLAQEVGPEISSCVGSEAQEHVHCCSPLWWESQEMSWYWGQRMENYPATTSEDWLHVTSLADLRNCCHEEVLRSPSLMFWVSFLNRLEKYSPRMCCVLGWIV